MRSWGRRTLNAGGARAQRIAARIAGQPDAPIAIGLLIFYLAILLFALVLIVGALNNWHTGSGRGDVFVGILWHTVWIFFQVLKVTWIVLVIIWVSRWFSKRRAESSD
jgi:hypothetical protein